MAYSEADTKAKLITPKLKESGWTELHLTREHGFKYYFTEAKARKQCTKNGGWSECKELCHTHYPPSN